MYLSIHPSFYHLSYSFIIPSINSYLVAELKLTCEAVIGLQVNDHLLELLFTLFDDNSKSCDFNYIKSPVYMTTVSHVTLALLGVPFI